jgi:4-amino-4-deoxy-L-arabinose transferase-like glycosyltransferase
LGALQGALICSAPISRMASSNPFFSRPRLVGASIFMASAIPLFLLVAWDTRVERGALFGIPLTALAALGLTQLFLPFGRARDSLDPVRPSAPLLRVVLLASLVLFPFLGTYALWDPWETHYGEVAREILARNDWVSLWWAQDNWFFSKPILIFWMEALAMSALGFDPSPDANPVGVEWAIRLPHALLALVAVMLVYRTVARFFGTRAGTLSALVMATCPHFVLLGRQAITDMPLAASVIAAVSLLALAYGEDDEARVSERRLGPVAVSLKHAVIFAISLLALPQALYLMGLNLSLGAEGVRLVGDSMLFGSAGNEGVEGNPVHAVHRPAMHAELGPVDLAQPFFQGLVWLGLLGLALWVVAREEKLRALHLYGFYLFCAVAFMAKGIPGFALPGVAALFYLIVTGRFRLLVDGELRITRGALVLAVVGLPWYVAMVVRHGMGFLNRLLVHDHINRLAAGVHGDTGTIGYFLEQLGPSTFIWTGLLPAALLYALARSSVHERGGRDVLLVFALFHLGAFTLFSAMVTKFHHYIFPAVPPLAVLGGIFFERFFGKARGSKTELVGGALAALSSLALALFFGSLFGDLRGVLPEGAEGTDAILEMRPGILVSAALLITAVGAGALSLRALGGDARAPEEKALVVTAIAGGVLLAFVGRDLSWVTAARPHGYERLIHLFVYKYERPWPAQFDYRPILTGFSIAAALLFFALALPRLRAFASRAFLGLALAFSLFIVGVYMRDLSDHWSVRPLTARYYELRQEGDPIGAWQMNWKGENFYTGNRVEVFINKNAEMLEFLRENESRDVYMMLEHTRVPGFEQKIGGRTAEPVTTVRECNKFVLLRIRSAPKAAQTGT